jgi:hypothetical protein
MFGSEGATASDPIDWTGLIVEDLLPMHAAVGRLGESARRAAGVVDERIARRCRRRPEMRFLPVRRIASAAGQ